MKKVLVHFYSKNNFGDDLFIKILTDRYIDKFSIIAILPNVCFEGIANLKVYSNKVLFTLSKAIEKVLGARNLALQYLMKKNDMFVYVGGSIFIENNITIWRKEKKFYDKLNAPYYILGSNFGPSKTAEFKNIVKKIASGAQDVCFRDRASYNLFKDVSSARVATDIAFTVNTKDFDTIAQEKRIIFSVIDAYKKFDEQTAARYEQEIIKLVEKSIENGYQVTLMSFCKYEGDESAIEQILAKMDNDSRKKVDTYMYRGDLDEALTVLAKSEIVVASRFHASILGLLFGKKVLPMAYSDKTTNILNDMSFEGPVIDIRKIDEFDGSTFDFSSLKVNDVSAQKKLAEKQFQELDKVLTRRK